MWRTSAWAVALSVLGVMWIVLAGFGGIENPESVAVILVTSSLLACGVIFWALWQTRRQRKHFEEQLTTWAAERAAQEERLRIARELHDLASHGLGLITVRAASARIVTGTAAEEEHIRALVDIEEAGRVATSELRRMLGLLRSPEQDAPRHPAAMLADLPAVIDEARRAGSEAVLEAELHELRDVPQAIQSAAIAVAREGVANALRHAGPVPLTVRAATDPDALHIDVVNDEPRVGWIAHPGAGHGLIGVRERVAVFGGEVRAEPRGGGFSLSARFPLGEE